MKDEIFCNNSFFYLLTKNGQVKVVQLKHFNKSLFFFPFKQKVLIFLL